MKRMASSTRSGSDKNKGQVVETPAQTSATLPATPETITGFEKTLKECVGKDTHIVPGCVLAAVDKTGTAKHPTPKAKLTENRGGLLPESSRSRWCSSRRKIDYYRRQLLDRFLH